MSHAFLLSGRSKRGNFFYYQPQSAIDVPCASHIIPIAKLCESTAVDLVHWQLNEALIHLGARKCRFHVFLAFSLHNMELKWVAAAQHVLNHRPWCVCGRERILVWCSGAHLYTLHYNAARCVYPIMILITLNLWSSFLQCSALYLGAERSD